MISFIIPNLDKSIVTSFIIKLPESLKDDTTRMNDINKQKMMGQINHQKAGKKANTSVFLFFPNAHFLKTILAHRIIGAFVFARHLNNNWDRPFAKPQEPFFFNARLKVICLN